VVALIASGLSNDEISRQLYVSASTAKTHTARAMTKLGARDGHISWSSLTKRGWFGPAGRTDRRAAARARKRRLSPRKEGRREGHDDLGAIRNEPWPNRSA
jgi:DNA-binding NarL/FixJ family response regulator